MIDYYLLGVSCILMHEMDAIRCKEWRIFPGLSYLKDKLGLITFLFLHLPLFYILLLEDIFYDAHFKIGFDYFLIIHLVLHLLFLFHPKNEFKDWISWIIIGAAALFGFLDIIMT